MRCWDATAVASERQFEPQLRLHALSWLFALLGFVRQFILPLAAALFFGARNDPELWGLLAAVPLLGAALWHQYTFRYGFGPRGLVIRDGLLFRNVRQIDYARIENIDTVRGPLHRMLGVTEVRVETSTGGKPEALIRVLGLRDAAELRERIVAGGRPKPAQQGPRELEEAGDAAAVREAGRAMAADAAALPAGERSEPRTAETLVHLPFGELVRFGLVDNRGIVIVAALTGLAFQNGAGELMAESMASWMPSLEEFEALGALARVALGVSLLISVLVLLRLLSIVLAILTFHDFRLTREAGELRVRHGLLTRVSLTLRLPRIQAVHQNATLMHRLLRRVSLSVDLAGDSGPEGQNEHSAKRARWLAPVIPPERAARLIAAALPDADLAAQPDWRPLAPRARGRIFRKNVVVAFLVALVPLAWLAIRGSALPWAWLLVAIPPLAWWHASAYVRYTRWALADDLIMFRCGWLTRRLVMAPRNRVQTVWLAQSPLDRRARMGTVSVDTAGASAGSLPIRIPYLELEIARGLAAALYRSAAVPEPSRVSSHAAVAQSPAPSVS